MFRPIDNNCMECGRAISITTDRHYIVWDATHQVYRRLCAECDETLHNRPYDRKTSTDSLIASVSANPTPPKKGKP